jgi:hypothetical protein
MATNEETGLAFMAAIKLVKNNFLGYGFGFVEAYFANSSLIIKGLRGG